jgi:hypothetical protein
MKINIWEKIEWVREQPEHIRMRYVIGCLAVSMTFVIGIWLLSLKESFGNISRDVSNTAEKSKEQLPDVKMPALDSLLEQDAPLGAGANKKEEKSGQEYFEEQFRSQNPEQNQEETTNLDAGQMPESIPAQIPLQTPETDNRTTDVTP